MKKSLKPRILSALKRDVRIYAHHRHDAEGGGKDDLVIGSYNVHKCVGTDGRFDPGRTVDVICEMDADVVALQEACKRFGRRAGLVDFAEIERRTGLMPIPLTRAGSHGWHGNTLLLRSGIVRGLQRLSLPGVEPRGALVVDLELEAGPLRIIAAHLGLLRHSRMRQVETLLTKAAHVDNLPTLILGDLNEWRVGPRSSLSALHPTFAPMQAVLPSFPAQFPLLPLDRVLGSPHDLVKRIEVHDTPLARVASDHLPLRAHVNLTDARGGNKGKLLAA